MADLRALSAEEGRLVGRFRYIPDWFRQRERFEAGEAGVVVVEVDMDKVAYRDVERFGTLLSMTVVKFLRAQFKTEEELMSAIDTFSSLQMDLLQRIFLNAVVSIENLEFDGKPLTTPQLLIDAEKAAKRDGNQSIVEAIEGLVRDVATALMSRSTLLDGEEKKLKSSRVSLQTN